MFAHRSRERERERESLEEFTELEFMKYGSSDETGVIKILFKYKMALLCLFAVRAFFFIKSVELK